MSEAPGNVELIGLFRRAIAGDQKAFEMLFVQLDSYIRTRIRWFKNHRGDLRTDDSFADDAHQDCWVRICDFCSRAAEPPTSPRAWLEALVMNACRDLARKSERQGESVPVEGLTGKDLDQIARQPENNWLRIHVRELLARLLTPEERQAVELCLDGWKCEETAKEMGLPPDQVRYRIETAFAKLRMGLKSE